MLNSACGGFGEGHALAGYTLLRFVTLPTQPDYLMPA